MAILRVDAVLIATGHRSKTSIYNQVKDGLLPQPLTIAQRAKGWLDHEIQTVVAAQAVGQSKDEIRALVQSLHAQRAERFKLLLAGAVTPSASNVIPLVGAA